MRARFKGSLQGAALLVVGAVALTAAFIAHDHRGYHTPKDVGLVPVFDVSPTARPTPSRHHLTASPRPTQMPRPPAAAASPVGAIPLSVRIPGIGVRAPVVTVAIRSHALDVPEDPKTLGWWRDGAKPGSSHGSVVVVGHVDSAVTGKGALFRLEQVTLGLSVTVHTTKTDVHYRVVARQHYGKASLPSSVFATTGVPRLILITCGGPFNTHTRHYRDNVVVYALPV